MIRKSQRSSKPSGKLQNHVIPAAQQELGASLVFRQGTPGRYNGPVYWWRDVLNVRGRNDMTGDATVLTGAVRGIAKRIVRLLTEWCTAVSIDDCDIVLTESTGLRTGGGLF